MKKCNNKQKCKEKSYTIEVSYEKCCNTQTVNPISNVDLVSVLFCYSTDARTAKWFDRQCETVYLLAFNLEQSTKD